MSDFWDGLNAAPSSPSALPRGGVGATSSFWDDVTTDQSGQTAPVLTPQVPSEVEDSPGNPISYLFGMAKNVVMDIPDVLKGLWTIGKATTEDAWAGAMQVVPGQQSAETRVEEQGYQWGQIARAATGWGDQGSVVLEDYKSRFGFNGLEEVKDQLYSNPLSYILDALAVAGGVSVAAKAGAKLGVVSEGAVGAIRGISPVEQAARTLTGGGRPVTETIALRGALGEVPVESFASTVTSRTAAGAVQPGLFGVSTSFNPLKRMIQNTIINKVLTRSTDDVTKLIEAGRWEKLGISPENTLLTGQGEVIGQAAERVALGAQQGLRIMKPLPEKFIASRAARYISGVSKAEFYGQRNSMVQSLQKILGVDSKNPSQQDWKLVKDIMGTDDYLLALLRGEKVPLKGMPDNSPIDYEDGTLLTFTDVDAPPVGMDPGGRIEALKVVQNYFRNTSEVPGTTFWTPHSTPIGRNMRGTGIIGNMADAPGEARKLANASGWNLLGVRNHLADPDSTWNSMNYYYDTGNGIFELNIADQSLYDAQRLASVIRQHVDNYIGVDMAYNNEIASLRELTDDILPSEMGLSGEDARALARLEQVERLGANLKDELDAATMVSRRVFDRPLRRMHGDQDGNYGEENTMRVDDLYNWTTEWNMLNMAHNWNKDWAKGVTRADGTVELIHGPFTTALNRAFMPQKLEALHHITEFGREQVEKLIRDNINDTKQQSILSGVPIEVSTAEIVDNIAELFEDIYHLPREAVRDALMVPSDFDVAKAMWSRGKQGGEIANPDARATIRQMAQDTEPGEILGGGDGRFMRDWRPRYIPNLMKEPKEAANLVIDRMMNAMRMPILKGEIEGQLLDSWSWRTFAEASPQLPGYFPHIRSGSASGLWWKGSTMTAPKMAFKDGFKGYLQESGRIQADVFKSYSFRAYQQLRHAELIDQFENLRPMARELSQQELMLIQTGAMNIDGQVLFSPDYAKKQLSLHSSLLDDITERFDGGDPYVDAARDALNGINDDLQKISTEALAGAKVYVLPKYVADQFKAGYLQGFSPAAIRMFWDKPRDAWISTTLGMNPRWFIYRAMGNIVFAGVGGGMRDVTRLFGWGRAKNNEMIQMLLRDSKMPDGETNVLDMVSRGYAAGEMQKIGYIGGGAKPGKLGTPPSPVRMREWGSAKDEWPTLTKLADWVYNRRVMNLPKGIIGRMTRKVNMMEQAERRGIALGAYGKAIGQKWESNINLATRIAKEGIDEGLAARMQTEANWILGNYTMLSPLERDVVRRFLMPFYPFYRHMVKFATRMPWDHPVKSQVLRLLHEVDEDMGPHLPDYMGGAAYVGMIGGTPNYWNITHWNPLSELALGHTNPLTGFDPRLRMMISAFTGTDPFNKAYHADNVYTAPNGVEMIRTSTGWQKFEGIQHEPWTTMLMSFYSGPGSALINAETRGWNMTPQKAIASQLGVTLSPYDVTGNALRDMEAEMAAINSPTAMQTPTSWGQ